MDRRLQLSDFLHTLCDNVYFQEPPNTGMKYPCILYAIDDEVVRHGDNRPYIKTDRYLVTTISRDPDSTLWRQITDLPGSSFVRRYTADNLIHTVINLHF